MTLLVNILRVLFACVWTGMVGVPLLVFIYAAWAYGLLRARFGRRDVLDRVLEANAYCTGWVAQRLWASVLLPLAGIRLRTREVTPIDWATAHIICANHASVFDILALVRAVPPPFRFVAKRELLKWPIIGWALRPAGQIVVDRGNHSSAMRTMTEAAQRQIRGQVIFFVEGTRTRNGQLQPFKKGAFHFATDRQVKVLPTAVCGSYAVLAKVPWWRLRPGRHIEIVFCPPIDPLPRPSDETAARAVETLRTLTREQIAAALAGAEQPPTSV